MCHTIYVNFLLCPKNINLAFIFDNEYWFLQNYGIYANLIGITYYILLALVGILILNKLDFGKPTPPCVQSCVKLNVGYKKFYIFKIKINIYYKYCKN